MGLPTQKGKVLIIELDTPARLVADRMQKLPGLPDGSVLDLLFLPPLSVPVLSPKDMGHLTAAAQNNYDLVIINTLRKTHNLNDKESSTPAMVYGFYQRTFPGSALLFVHHSKKAQLNQSTGQYEQGLSEDTFSGAKNFLNDAQVGLQLRRFKHSAAGTNLQLRIEKSQVSAMYVPMLLRLEADGSNLSCFEAEQLERVRNEISKIGKTKTDKELDERLATILGVSVSTARSKRLESLEPVWLKRKDELESEENG